MQNEDYNKQMFKKLGKNIQRMRNKKQITLRDLSIKTGIKIGYLIKIEDGKAYGIRLIKHISKIAAAMEIPICKLLEFK